MTQKESPCLRYGDVDNDGYVTQADADLISQYVIEVPWEYINTPLTEEEFIKRADVDGIGGVSADDARMVARYVAGLEDTFPVCETIKQKFPVKETILYGASAAGLFIAGTAVKSVVPKYKWVGWILQIATVIPVGMLGLLLYNYFKEFELGTEELEMLAL